MCFTMCELDSIKAKLETLLGLKLRTNLIKEDPECVVRYSSISGWETRNVIVNKNTNNTFISGHIRMFVEGLASFQNKEGFWGFVDTNCDIVIPAMYRAVCDFHNGYAVVVPTIAQEGKWREGIINKDNEFVLQPEYSIASVGNGLYIVSHRETGLYGVFSPEKGFIVPVKYSLIREATDSCKRSLYFRVMFNNRKALYDTEGKFVMNLD